MAHETSLTAFICYRRVDGAKYAAWIADALFGASTTDEAGRAVKVFPYYDQEAPGVSDWRKHHFPSLETSETLIVIVTPGIAADLGTPQVEDWVYEELRWWVSNRSACPIVIDCTSEGARWIPKPITNKWPNLNWIAISDTNLQTPGGATPLVRRILKTVEVGSRTTLFEDLQRQRRLSKRFRTALITSVTLLFLTITTTIFAIWAANERATAADQEQKARAIAEAQNVELQDSVIKLLFLCRDEDVDATAKLFLRYIEGTSDVVRLVKLTDAIVANQQKSAASIAAIRILGAYEGFGSSAALDEALARLFLSMGNHPDPNVKAAVNHLAEVVNADRHGYRRP